MINYRRQATAANLAVRLEHNACAPVSVLKDCSRKPGPMPRPLRQRTCSPQSARTWS